jgi:hypothetical protein
LLISFATKNWKHNFDEAQEDSEECFNRAEAFNQYKTVAGYRTAASADPNPELRARSTRITMALPRDLTAAIA